MLDEEEAHRLYGPWRSRTPAHVVELFAGYAGRWWIAGGWAVEAFTGVPREHGDIDPSIPRSDVALLHRHLDGRLDVWAADQGSLRPVLDPAAALPTGCSNLWLRRSGADPWEYDVVLMDATATTWTYKRDDRIARPVDEILRTVDGVTYLRPEVQLLHKAPGLRPKDQQDFDACLPLLDGTDRAWLADALRLAHPGHPWIRRLRPTDGGR